MSDLCFQREIILIIITVSIGIQIPLKFDKVVDIKRMANAGVFIFPFFVRGQGRARGGVGRGVGAIIFICDTLYQPNTHCFTFS